MQKVEFQNVPIIYPLPAVLVSCGNMDESLNIITISWTGTVCSEPAMCYISVRKS
ncbi:MAG TPA: flavin reductase, partial [Bacteroidales bacterium]|nr:flavin reductase [Bacteroidales bacterium]